MTDHLTPIPTSARTGGLSVYNPGCALMLYKPHLADRVLDWLCASGRAAGRHDICCRHDPQLPAGARIVNTCAGCDRRFSSLYPGISTISLWELLARAEDFPLPNYQGLPISVHDPCPVRGKPQIHEAVRRLLERMNLRIVEAGLSGASSVCCGDSFYPALPLEQVYQRMGERADSMPCDDVCVYCVSCIKAMHLGRKRPRYLLDLLFGEPTDPQVCDPRLWHGQLDAYIETH